MSLREITDDTMKVVYAIRLSFTGGEPQLRKIDQILKDAVETAFPDDPLLRITRGDTATMRDNPYPSAGFLHDGGARIADLPGPAQGSS